MAVVDATMTAQAPQRAPERTKLIQPVKTVNESNALGDNNNELTVSVDRIAASGDFLSEDCS
jgi:hypothetical protein